MKTSTKITITIALIGINLLVLPIILPSIPLIENSMTLATVNGGNAEYVASKAAHSWSSTITFIAKSTIYAVIAWIWLRGFFPAKNKNPENYQKNS